jgi:hypothetical protein
MENQTDNPDNSRIPVFGSWKGWYIFILAILLIQILLYSWLTFTYL